jgi:hypothetical protein
MYVRRPRAAPDAGEADGEVSDSDDEPDTATSGAQYYAISAAQEAFIEDVRSRAHDRHTGLATWTSFKVCPDNPLCGSGMGSIARYCLRPVHLWAPHLFFKRHGIPPQPPCPYKHGWDAATQKQVIQKGWVPAHKARRVSGVAQDDYLLGTMHQCLMCKEERAAAVRVATAGAISEEARVSAVAAAEQQHPYYFRSTDVGVTRLYTERFPFVALQMPAVICSRRTALTRPLARLVRRLVGSGSTPTDIASWLLELRAADFDETRAAYYSFQVRYTQSLPCGLLVPVTYCVQHCRTAEQLRVHFHDVHPSTLSSEWSMQRCQMLVNLKQYQ